MHRNITGLLMILLSSSINFSGQLLLRKTSRNILSSDANQEMKLTTCLLFIRKLFPPSKALVLGVALLVIALGIWIFALGFIRFSVGFPVYLALSICFSVLYSIVVSKESIGSFQYLGLALLILAIALLVQK